MIRCIPIKAVQTGVRRTYKAVTSPRTAPSKQQTLNRKFLYPFSFDEVEGASSGALLASQNLEKQTLDPKPIGARHSVLAPKILVPTHPHSDLSTLRSRLSQKFWIPFDEGPYPDDEQAKRGDRKQDAKSG